ncbi:hypothetical protein GCM10022421_32350 [Oceanisphaera sediminis]|uniref:Uncharacterized protein n=1 Tax=Oceanisphaera sediminis TaxID=981381 RepID=A0ABP7EPX3_9GAMM
MTFAKIFEIGDRQVLVTRCNDDEGDPAIKVSAELGGGVFSARTVGYRSTQQGYKARDKKFSQADEGYAKEALDELLASYAKTRHLINRCADDCLECNQQEGWKLQPGERVTSGEGTGFNAGKHPGARFKRWMALLKPKVCHLLRKAHL